MTETFDNIWDALIDDPVEKESYKIKSELMMAVELFINENKLTQQAAADLMGTTQPKVSNIVNGNIDKITIDLLVNMLAKVGKEITIKVSTLGAQKSLTKKTISESYSLLEYDFSDDYHQGYVDPYTLTDENLAGAHVSRWRDEDEIAAAG
jgi:predicted XRE-type DNA-binding protein